MKVVKTIKGQYVCVPDSIINDLPKKQIEEIYNSIPKEAKPSKAELKILTDASSMMEHLQENTRRYTEVIRPAMCYKNWTCISEEYLSEEGVDEFRNSFIEFDVDVDYELTAKFIIDFTNTRFIVELQQSGIALPELSDSYDNIDTAVNILTDYINSPEEYSDYK